MKKSPGRYWLKGDVLKSNSGDSVKNLQQKSVPELLSLHVSIIEELCDRNVLRSENNATGPLAEYLFCQAFGWEQAPNSQKGFDAVDKNGARYQIKGRRLRQKNTPRQLSSIRDLNGFDFVAAVLFDQNYRPLRAALIPQSVIQDHAPYQQHTNSHIFFMRDSVWDIASVMDVTKKLAAAMPD